MNKPELKGCPPFFARWIQQALDYAESVGVLQGTGTLINQAGNGRQISVNATNGGGPGGGVLPFTLARAGDLSFRVYASTIGGGSITDLGFAEGDTPPYVVTIAATGKFWGIITIDTDTGDITSRSLNYGASMPDDTTDTFYVEIGTYDVTDGTLTLSNTRYGPIGFTACRNLFDAEFPWRGVFS
jgi:hypothetical protein